MILYTAWFWLALLVVTSVTQPASSQGAYWLLVRVAHTVKHNSFLALALCICRFFKLTLHSAHFFSYTCGAYVFCLTRTLHKYCLVAQVTRGFVLRRPELSLSRNSPRLRLRRSCLNFKQQRAGYLAGICQGRCEPERSAKDLQPDGMGGRRQLLQMGRRCMPCKYQPSGKPYSQRPAAGGYVGLYQTIF